MNNFENFIKSLTDHELAIFVRYSYHGFLKKSQVKIDREIKKRNLSPLKLDKYSREKLNSDLTKEPNKCHRCGSLKRVTETDFWELPFNEFSSVEIANDSDRCKLCGYNSAKSSSGNFLEKIKREWERTVKSRFSKWNSI